MTKYGSLPLNTYANGGIANRAQMAIFGEGRKPEAYVPLPDGRSIPVTMMGAGGGGVSVEQHMHFHGDGKTSVETDASGDKGRQLSSMLKDAALQVIAEQKRPGGLLYERA
jgi:SLT domain-containing protein